MPVTVGLTRTSTNPLSHTLPFEGRVGACAGEGIGYHYPMGGYYISVNIKAADAAVVRGLVTDCFTGEGFQLIEEASASAVTEDEDKLPDGDDWYGVLVSGAAAKGWVSVYVEDWQDSGLLAKRLSEAAKAPVLELWVADDTHWGYNYYEAGEVRGRFADDPSQVAEGPSEAALYRGDAATLAPVLQVPAAKFETLLQEARANAGKFAAGAVDAVAFAVGLPFEHVFTSYEHFFEDDPEDYSEDLEDWPAFRHLAFAPPPGRETLSE